MSRGFLVDNQLPMELVNFFRSRGFECQHVLDVGLSRASDSEICHYAARNRTSSSLPKTKIFSTLASQPNSRIKLIWVRLGNCRTKALLAAFEGIWLRIEARLRAGERIIEVR
jgi:predicted nuclease of predicted toxin-antitoxin system